MEKKRLARWQSRGGKDWVELFIDEGGYTYKGGSCGGVLGADAAIALKSLLRVLHVEFSGKGAYLTVDGYASLAPSCWDPGSWHVCLITNGSGGPMTEKLTYCKCESMELANVIAVMLNRHIEEVLF